MDENQLAAAGFYFTNQIDVFRCAFCGVEMGHWEEGDGALKEHQLWSLSCGFAKGLYVGSIPILKTSLINRRISLPEVAICVGLDAS
jgi:hypothetical protein